MADRDVILKALVDFCWSKPHLQAIGPDLGLLAEVAARAVEAENKRLRVALQRVADFSAPCPWDPDLGDNSVPLSDIPYHVNDETMEIVKRALLDELAPPPVGTPAEAQACAARSGVGLGDVEHLHIEEL